MKNHAFLESCASAMTESGARHMHSTNVKRHGYTRRRIHHSSSALGGAAVPILWRKKGACFTLGRARRQPCRRPSRLNEKSFGAWMHAAAG